MDGTACKALYIDYSRCIGCETCEAVCRFLYDWPRIHMSRTRGGLLLPIYCRHCAEPHCMKACPRGAIKRDREGAVVQQPMICRGCKTFNCILGCPYSAIFARDQGVMVTKCDLCASRRDLGMGPACAEMCPTGAIHYVDQADLPALQTDEARKAEEKVFDHLRPASKKKE